MTPLDLQNGLYNFLKQTIGVTAGTPLQLVQPSTALPSSTSNPTLWAYMNNIPPYSLTQYIQSAGNQFFSNYQALMSALVPSLQIDFEGDIGTGVYNDWMAHLATLPTPPSVTQLPNLFLNWAFAAHPAVAVKGASDLSAQLLEPISRAQLALMPYTTLTGVTVGKKPDWSLGYAQLVSQLAAAPNKSFTSTSVQSNSNVSGTWTHGSDSGFLGLWGGSSSTSVQTQTFASQSVTLTVSFDHVTTFTPVPGAWYDSAAFGLAYSTKNGPLWNPKSAITWQSMFGPSGILQRFASSLVVVSGMKVTAQSKAVFSASDQIAINQNSGGGLWPFYSSNSSSGITTSHNFTNGNTLTIASSSQPGIPIVVGVTVLTDDQYLGHATGGLTMFQKLTSLNLPALSVAAA